MALESLPEKKSRYNIPRIETSCADSVGALSITSATSGSFSNVTSYNHQLLVKVMLMELGVLDHLLALPLV